MATVPNVVPIRAATGAGKSRSITQITTAAAAKNISTQTSGSGGGGQSDWAQSVETRLGELRTDVRNLLIAGGVVTFGLAAAGWGTYTTAMAQLREMAVTQQQIAGKIATLDAKVAGRLELMEQRLSDKSETGARAGQTGSVRQRP